VGSRTVESVNVLAIVVAALGGGIVASLLESWMSSVRRFETARLLLFGELLGNEAVSRGVEAAPGTALYRHAAWDAYAGVVATRLSLKDETLWNELMNTYRYIGAMPGSIIRALRDAESMNPVLLIDEIDKLGADVRGDPASAMLEVLDPEQNRTFRDHYLDLPFDHSKVLFICTANTVDTIPGPLLDRMDVISLSGYTKDEKLGIAKRYLVPKQIEAHGLTPDRGRSASTNAASARGWGRGITRAKCGGRTATPGVATGLAYTPAGGDVLFVEAQAYPGKGRLTITGQLGEVMQESAQAALSWVRAHAGQLGLADDWFADHDVHLHVPASAVSKDGPSAGITMATAIVSLVRNTPVSEDVGMTGEITLTGHVLPIGGVREKVLAAQRAGLKRVILPSENEPELEELPAETRRELDFVLVDSIEQVFDVAFDGAGNGAARPALVSERQAARPR
jgi:ATP-dependent Lon protease